MMPPRAIWASLLFAAILSTSFGILAHFALAGGPLQEFDNEVALGWRDAAANHQLRRWVMIGFTWIASVPAMAGLAVAGVLWRFRQRDRALAIAWMLIVAGGGLLNYAIKKAIDRPRPPVEWRDAAAHETNQSFPSGHSMGGMIGYGIAAFAVARSARRREWRFLTYLLAALVIGMVGLSRVYLRAHWFSDVIGGFAIGLAWLLFGLSVFSWIYSSRGLTSSRDARRPSERD